MVPARVRIEHPLDNLTFAVQSELQFDIWVAMGKEKLQPRYEGRLTAHIFDALLCIANAMQYHLDVICDTKYMYVCMYPFRGGTLPSASATLLDLHAKGVLDARQP